MSIATAITAAQGRVADCYTAISTMGGTLPATQNLSNMPAAIASIPSGGGGELFPNYTKVGSVIVSPDYIASGFSNSNYIQMGTFDPGSRSWEVCTKIHTASSIYGYMWMFKSLNEDKLALCLYNGNPDVNVGNGSTWYNGQVWTDTSVAPDTDYWYKMTFNGTNRYSVQRSTDGVNFTEIAYINETRLMASNTLIFGWKQYNESGSFVQSIDLKETYVKIGGSVIWRAVLEKGSTTLENFTTFGSPTIDENHVLTNLSNSNYVSIDKITPAASFDMIVPIKISSIPSSTQVILGTTGGAPNIYMENGSLIHCWTGSAGASGSTSLAINTKYWLRIVYDGSYSRVYLLQDNSYTLDTLPAISSWTQQFSFSGGAFCQKSFFLGKTQDGSAFSSGSFYLDDAIIKTGLDTYWTPYEIL